MTLQAFKIKQCRNHILDNLDMVYPSGMTTKGLYLTVCHIDPLYDRNLFGKDVTYLHEKGYVTYVDDKIGGMPDFDKKVVKLTAQGKEIAEQTRNDPALDI